MILTLLLTCLSAHAQNAALPPHVTLKSPGQSFTNRYEFALLDGRIWFQAAGRENAWTLFDGTGLPPDSDAPSVASISADGDSLVAVTPARRIFDAELNHDKKSGALKIKWNKGFGWPLRLGARPLYLPEGNLGFAASIVDSENAVYYSDPNGTPHLIMGINTLYTLAADGQEIRFDDPWLPPNDFKFHFATPDHGRVKAVALSASGSTVLVVDRIGRLFTRIIDFDTLGGNPGIAYSYAANFNKHAKGEGTWASVRTHLPFLFDLRKLPGDGWHEQPRVKGEHGELARITGRITILTTGKGNDARELRVEGVAQVDGRQYTGFFSKPIDPKETGWRFTATDAPLEGHFLEIDAAPETAVARGETHDGQADLYDTRFRVGPEQVLKARLEQFNLDFDEAIVAIRLRDGSVLRLPLHLTADIFPFGETGTINGALLVPPSNRRRSHEAMNFVSDWLYDHKALPVRVRLTKGLIEIQVNRLRATRENSMILKFPRH
jgi:hypothetical protein